MRALLNLPHSLFFMGAVLMVLVSFFFPGQTIDIHVHDTYYIIGIGLYFLVFGLLFLIFGIIYTACRKILLAGPLVWIHFILSLISVGGIVVFALFLNKSRSYLMMDPGIRDMISVFILLFLLAQLVFLVNIIGGAVRKLV